METFPVSKPAIEICARYLGLNWTSPSFWLEMEIREYADYSDGYYFVKVNERSE